jgi:hypothetical protein
MDKRRGLDVFWFHAVCRRCAASRDSHAPGGPVSRERMALALWLGDEDVALYLRAHRGDPDDARAALRRARAVGRPSSLSNDV